MAYDEDYIITAPGLFPDALIPLEDMKIEAILNLWQSLWNSVKVPKDIDAQKYLIEISLTSDEFNTGAAELAHSNYFDNAPTELSGNYSPIMVEKEKTVMPGGLYGSICLYKSMD